MIGFVRIRHFSGMIIGKDQLHLSQLNYIARYCIVVELYESGVHQEIQE